jgi:hypothetical protein
MAIFDMIAYASETNTNIMGHQTPLGVWHEYEQHKQYLTPSQRKNIESILSELDSQYSGYMETLLTTGKYREISSTIKEMKDIDTPQEVYSALCNVINLWNKASWGLKGLLIQALGKATIKSENQDKKCSKKKPCSLPCRPEYGSKKCLFARTKYYKADIKTT